MHFLFPAFLLPLAFAAKLAPPQAPELATRGSTTSDPKVLAVLFPPAVEDLTKKILLQMLFDIDRV
ncbi:Uu.00g065500.m01.CDS01, partial [Anthostomella pinea]